MLNDGFLNENDTTTNTLVFSNLKMILLVNTTISLVSSLLLCGLNKSGYLYIVPKISDILQVLVSFLYLLIKSSNCIN